MENLTVNQILWSIIGLFFLIALVTHDYSSSGSNDLYENASQKINNGQYHSLTKAEAQRVHDITVGWCESCNTARRLRKHGR
jgi:hypothetical protein